MTLETANTLSPETPEDTSVPASALWLGGTGALPFVACAMLAVFGTQDWQGLGTQALVAYGAVILSFLGGVHWGLAIGRGPSSIVSGSHLILSVVPSLVGWAALLLPVGADLLLLALAFAAMFIVDLRLTQNGPLPAWYPRLRLPLTIVVMTSLLVGAAG